MRAGRCRWKIENETFNTLKNQGYNFEHNYGVRHEVAERGCLPLMRRPSLELSTEKTRIVHIKEGFNFLGFNIRKYGDKLIIKPAKENVKRFLTSIRDIINKSRATKTENLLQQLNPTIRGWTNYYRNVVSKQTFASVDAQIFKALRSEPQQCGLLTRPWL